MKKRWITAISMIGGAIGSGLIEIVRHVDLSALVIGAISTLIGGK